MQNNLQREGTLKSETGFNLANWTKLAKVGSTTAVSGLSQMVNREFTIKTLSIEEISTRNTSNLIGKPEDLVVGIYLLFSGNTNGQILLAFKPEIAYELVDMAMGTPPGSTNSLGEMERSVLGEMGNIVGSFFLNGVADLVGLRLMPSPPVVVEDMAGALIGSVLAEAFRDTDSLFIIKLLFSSPSKEMEGKFLVLPSFEGSEDANLSDKEKL
jgi:chemotaxis protein CheC